jgi:hypothetical protein
MYCPSCGAQNAEGSQFCENCGAALGEPSSSPAPPTPVTPVATPSVSSGTTKDGGLWAKIGIVVSVIGFLLFPLGIIGIIIGYVGYTKGDQKLGMIAIVLGFIATVFQLLLFL